FCWFGYQEISGVLSWDTCIALVVTKSRNHPTDEIHHWGLRCLVVGRMAVSVVQWKEREAELHPFRYEQNGGVGH
ncbi:hypothetical protein AVEN_199103-1, partial [Araneus ventricosus]